MDISIDTANEANSMVHQDGGLSFSTRKCHDVSAMGLYAVFRETKCLARGHFIVIR